MNYCQCVCGGHGCASIRGRLVGSSEAADILGVSRQRFGSLKGDPDFPRPVVELAVGDIWDTREVERYRWTRSKARRGRGARTPEGVYIRELRGMEEPRMPEPTSYGYREWVAFRRQLKPVADALGWTR